MLHRWGFLLLFFIAIFTGDAIAGAYYEESYQEYRPRRSYRKVYSPQPRYTNYSKRNYQNRSYKKRSRRTYRPISSYKTNFLPERIYVGAALGHTSPLGFETSDGSLNSSPGGPVYSILTGADVFNWLRTGIEITHLQKHKVKGSTAGSIEAQIDTTTLMINNYLTLPKYTIKPYALIGIGMSWNSISDYHAVGSEKVFSDDTKSSFAYQAGGGISFPYKNFAFDGEVKYVNKGKVQTKAPDNATPQSAKLKDLVFSMSLRYYFNNLQT